MQMKQFIGVAKRTGETLILTPLYTRIEEPLDTVGGFAINFSLSPEEPAAYVLEVEDECKVFGPSILKDVEIVGDL